MSLATFNLLFFCETVFQYPFVLLCFLRDIEYWKRPSGYRLLIIVSNILSAVVEYCYGLSNYCHSESFRNRGRLLCVWTEWVYNCKQTISLFIIAIFIYEFYKIPWYTFILQVDISPFIVCERMVIGQQKYWNFWLFLMSFNLQGFF